MQQVMKAPAAFTVSLVLLGPNSSDDKAALGVKVTLGVMHA
jgi:hypothetical protein